MYKTLLHCHTTHYFIKSPLISVLCLRTYHLLLNKNLLVWKRDADLRHVERCLVPTTRTDVLVGLLSKGLHRIYSPSVWCLCRIHSHTVPLFTFAILRVIYFDVTSRRVVLTNEISRYMWVASAKSGRRCITIRVKAVSVWQYPIAPPRISWLDVESLWTDTRLSFMLS